MVAQNVNRKAGKCGGENRQKPREPGHQEPPQSPEQEAAVGTAVLDTSAPLSWVLVSLAPGRSPMSGHPDGCMKVMGHTVMSAVESVWDPFTWKGNSKAREAPKRQLLSTRKLGTKETW